MVQYWGGVQSKAVKSFNAKKAKQREEEVARETFAHEHVMLTAEHRAVLRVGYLGAGREKFVNRMDKMFGPGNWTIGYVLDGLPVDRGQALSLYQQSYTNFLRANPEFTDRMLREASDVYDTNPSNVESGLDWHHQEDSRSHLQDIAVRRAVRDLGREFTGKKLMQIRGQGSDLPELNPGRVPFVLPEHILDSREYVAPWIQIGSVEDFWQNNKFVFVRPSIDMLARLYQEVEGSIKAKRASDYKLVSEKLAAIALCGGGTSELTRKFVSYVHEMQEALWRKGRRDVIPEDFVQRWIGFLVREQSRYIAPSQLPSDLVLKIVDTLMPAIRSAPVEIIGAYTDNDSFCAAIICSLAKGPFPLSDGDEELARYFLQPDVLDVLDQDPTFRAALRSTSLGMSKPWEIREKLLDAGLLRRFTEEEIKKRFLEIIGHPCGCMKLEEAMLRFRKMVSKWLCRTNYN